MSAEVGFGVLAALLGTLGGIGGLLGRYRAKPTLVLFTLPAGLYIALNLGMALLTYCAVVSMGVTFGVGQDEAIPWVQALVAGVGGLALLRASFYTVRLGDQTLQIGPAMLLESILQTLDREVDRAQAENRALAIRRIMAGVSFEKAYLALPAYCFALVQQVEQDTQAEFAQAMRALRDTPMSDATKAMLMGAQLANLVGEDVLEAAVKALGAEIAASPALQLQPAEE